MAKRGNGKSNGTVTLARVETRPQARTTRVRVGDPDLERYEDVAAITAMTLITMGNYASTGHFGGPLAYTPMVTAAHLAPPERGGLRYDIRAPKHPYADKYMMAGGHCAPTNYALWILLYEAMARQFESTGKKKYRVDPKTAFLAVDALGFRRSAGALKSILNENGLDRDPLFRQARGRGIRALSGHTESTDGTNDVNGGPSGVGIATMAGKAFFWDFMGADPSLKLIAVEGDFAMTEGHAQELKTAALALEPGKRLRILLSDNNAGIDDALRGQNGVIHERHAKGYDLRAQWSSYGWNVLHVQDGNDMREVLALLRAMEGIPANDGRPVIAICDTIKGWWPGMKRGRIPSLGMDTVIGAPSHPYKYPLNDPYYVALADTYERRYGISFRGIRDGKPTHEAERLIQFKTNIDAALSVLDTKPGLREWIADRLLETAGKLPKRMRLAYPARGNPFDKPRLKVKNLPTRPTKVRLKDPRSKKVAEHTVELFITEPGKKWGARRAISEVVKWMNHVSGNRFITVAADLSGSINVEGGHFFGHYNRFDNPSGTRLKAAITEAVNASTVIGAVNQTLSKDPKVHNGLWGISGTYGAFTPLMYLPARVYSQQNQDSPFGTGVLTILAGHSGPETAADARTHFGIFAPQVWNLFPRGQAINLHCADYNDVAPAYIAATEWAVKRKEIGVIVLHVARPDTAVFDRSKFADRNLKAAARGAYVIRDFAKGRPRHGTILVQGASATVNVVEQLDRFEEAGINIKVVAVVSEDLFNLQTPAYREKVFAEPERFDCTFITTGTKRVPPLANLPPSAEAYCLSADWDDRWRSGGSEADIIAEARLDPESIFEGIRRFARDRKKRLATMRRIVGKLR